MNVNLSTIGLPVAQATNPAIETSTTAPGTAAPTTKPVDKPWWANDWVILVPLMLLMFWFMSNSKRKQQKKEQALVDSIKKGARIQTIGGIIGTVVDIRDDEVVVKVDETSNTKMTFVRKAIFRVREDEKK